jgi:hypothetical protein
MEDNYWRSDEDQALSAFVKTYDNHADFGLFVEFCQLKQKGLRKPALQKVEQFVKFCQSRPLEKQREIVKCILDFFINAYVYSLDIVLVSPIRQYMIAVFEHWREAEPNNVNLYIALAKLTRQRVYYFQGLEIDPTNQECARQVILTKLDFVDYQLHHVSESKFVYDAGDEKDGELALQEVYDLLEKYPDIDDYVKQEYQDTKQLFDDWIAFTQSEFDDFPTWCQAHHRHYKFISAYYYTKD